MNVILKSTMAIALSLAAFSTFAAAPEALVTHNNTNEQSNAFIAGVPSPYPTEAHSTRKLYWNLVRMACFGHTTNGECAAVIKMATNTKNPIVLGTVKMNLESGDITPKVLASNGYTMVVNGPGEATINKD